MEEMQVILMGDVVYEGCPLKGKTAGADKQEKTAEKVTEIEFFEVGNHAGNGHLSTDKRTKSLDKVFILKKTFTEFDTVFFKTNMMSHE